MQKLRNLLFRLPAYSLSAICFATICYLTLVPHPLPENDLSLIPGIDKIVHAIMFFGLNLCLLADIYRRDIKRNSTPQAITLRSRVIATILASLAGIAIEVLQEVMHIGRSGDYIDLIADIAGVAIATFTAPMILKFIFQPKS